MSSKIVISVTGDALITQGLSRNKDEILAIQQLLEQSDVRFINLETTIHGFEGDVYAASTSGGDWIVAPPAALSDLKWLGFNMMTFANNHTLDWSYGGLEKTMKHLEQGGIVHAGVGENLAEANRPKYYETANGRVALIATCSTFRDWHVASEQRRDVRGRPGLNPLGFKTIHRITQEEMTHLKTIASLTDIHFVQTNLDGRFQFGEQLFEVGEPGTVTEIVEKDAQRIKQSIQEAARQADVVLVSHHSHEMKGEDKEELTEFQREFAHMCIEAGAHAYLGHGPHVLRGIEIYKGFPIFHGLGDFFYQAQLLEKQPIEFYESKHLGDKDNTADGFDISNRQPDLNEKNPKCFESVIGSFEIEDGQLQHLTIRPVTLGFDLPRSRRGLPMFASIADSERILRYLQDLSAPFGTKIEIKDGYGRIY